MYISDPSVLLDSLANGIMIVDDNYTVKYWNRWLEINTTVHAESITDQNLKDFYPDIDYKVLHRKIKTALSLNVSTFYDASLQNRFIEIKRTKITTSLLDLMQLQVIVSPYIADQRLVMISIYDISDLFELKLSLQNQMKKIEELNVELRRDKEIIDAHLLIIKIDEQCNIVEASHEFTNLFGSEQEELIGSPLRKLFGDEIEDVHQEHIRDILSVQSKWCGELVFKAPKNEAIWLDAVITLYNPEDFESPKMYTAIFHDITDKKRIELLSVTDPLTKLYNRNKFNEVFDYMSMRKHWSENNSFALIICDVDHFKKVNDTYGHPKGDEVLVNVAKTLSETIRTGDILARWGGEEFVCILPDVSQEKALYVAEKFRVALGELTISEVGHITASFGVSLHKSGDTQETMMHRSDEALYKAKQNGRNRVEFL